MLNSIAIQAQPSQALSGHIGTIVADFATQTETTHTLPYGLMVGIIDADYHYAYGYGSIGSLPPDSNRLFGIGAVTKTFTASILHALSRRGIVQYNDALTRYLPDSITAANPDLQQITLGQLATHTAGLPKDPDNLADTYTDNSNPYQQYRIADLYAFLQAFKKNNKSAQNTTTRKSAKNKTRGNFQHTNTSTLLLAHCLERATGQSYAQLLHTYIAQPLAMTQTIAQPLLSEQQQLNLAQGLTFHGNIVAPLAWGEVPGAEAIYSSPADMLRYVEAYLSADAQSDFSFIDRPATATGNKQVTMAGGWFLFRRNKHSPVVLTHSGRGGGYACYVAFEPRRKVAVILMANADRRIDELGISILDFLLR